jgi:hypothetical protein
MRPEATDMTRPAALILGIAAGLALGGCGGGNKSQTENNINALESAAEQSTPQARDILLNEADRLEGQNVHLPPNAPGSPTQEAMNKAGNVQAQQAAPPQQAQPHRAGEPTPPPKVTPPQQ